MIKFEWDAAKAAANLRKHGISFEEAQSVFYDDFALQFFDEGHSSLDEERFLMLGISSQTNLLMVCHCERADAVIRIISARKATRNEAKFYKGRV